MTSWLLGVWDAKDDSKSGYIDSVRMHTPNDLIRISATKIVRLYYKFLPTAHQATPARQEDEDGASGVVPEPGPGLTDAELSANIVSYDFWKSSGPAGQQCQTSR